VADPPKPEQVDLFWTIVVQQQAQLVVSLEGHVGSQRFTIALFFLIAVIILPYCSTASATSETSDQTILNL